MATELSADRKEFARLCGLEIQKAAKLSGVRLPDLETIKIIALDMASSRELSRIPCHRVAELFSHARANFNEAPILRHLVKSAQAIKPIDAPSPKDTPRLPPPKAIGDDRAKWRKLAAIRTCLSEGGELKRIVSNLAGQHGMMAMRIEPWMRPLLAESPTIDEVRGHVEACPVGVKWFLDNENVPPFWGKWINLYGLAGSKNDEKKQEEETDVDDLPF